MRKAVVVLALMALLLAMLPGIVAADPPSQHENPCGDSDEINGWAFVISGKGNGVYSIDFVSESGDIPITNWDLRTVHDTAELGSPSSVFSAMINTPTFSGVYTPVIACDHSRNAYSDSPPIYALPSAHIGTVTFTIDPGAAQDGSDDFYWDTSEGGAVHKDLGLLPAATLAANGHLIVWCGDVGVAETDTDGDGTPDCNDCDANDARVWQLLKGYVDADGDSYGIGSEQDVCSGAGLPTGYASQGGDCNDNNTQIHPNATEICNNTDDDCDGQTDEGVKSTYYHDADGDGYGNHGEAIQACAPMWSYNVAYKDEQAVWTNTVTDEEIVGGENCYVVTTTFDANPLRYAPNGTPIEIFDATSWISKTTLDTFKSVSNSEALGMINLKFTETFTYSQADHGQPFALGDTYTYDLLTHLDPSALAPDSTDTIKVEVVALEDVTVPAGIFLCHRVQFTKVATNGEAVTPQLLREEWWATNDEFLGAVKMVEHAQWDAQETRELVTYVDLSDYALSDTDCDDENADVNPGATEVCDGKDNDCDGETDEGVTTTFYRDHDGDQYGVTGDTQNLCGPSGEYTAAQGGDCDDADAAINPGATEVCDGKDNDCDSTTDEDFPDNDSDGIANCVDTETCDGIDNDGNGQTDEGFPDSDSDGIADCVDTETCDGIDNNGNGQTDEGFPDNDNDGIANCVDIETCDGVDNDGDGQTDEGFPDNDNDGIANCVDTETCDGIDNNGNGQTDEGFPDNDNDGIANCVDTETCDGIDNNGNGQTDEGFPDNDNDGIANCVDTETCDGIDNNGNGQVDEGFPDNDSDGIANCVDTETCDGIDNNGNGQTDEGFPDNDSDGIANCVDTETCDGIDNNGNGQVDEGFPDNDSDGIADCVDTETCDGLDNDGDGQIDEGSPDNDGDGIANCVDTETCDGIDNNGNGQVDEGFADNDSDGIANCVDTETCDGVDNDGDGQTDEGFPDNDSDGIANCVDTETCDGIDNNGNGQTDEGFPDNDSDGIANCVDTETCDGIDNNGNGQTDEGFPDNDSDGIANCVDTETCDGIDNNGNGQTDEGFPDNDNDGIANCIDTETCDGVDNDGDGQMDEGVQSTFYWDADGDGYGAVSSGTVAACSAPSGYVDNSTDCNDGDGSVHPNADEVCNGTDDDCDGGIDEGVKTTFYRDADGDTYGDPNTTTQACSQPEGYVTDNTDCDDTKAAVHPGAPELCNGVDDDCDGVIDDGLEPVLTFYRDSDGDGYGNPNVSVQACASPSGYVSNNTDCNDNNANVNPGKTEIPCNGVDEDCALSTPDDQSSAYYRDADGDGYGDPNTIKYDCAQPVGYVMNHLDCNDSSVGVHPDAIETCNSIDDDCDGLIDEGVICGGGGAVASASVNYTLTITVGSTGGGTTHPVPGSYSYPAGTPVSVGATADEGYEFVNWGGDATGTSSTVLITLDGNKTITANFAEVAPTPTPTTEATPGTAQTPPPTPEGNLAGKISPEGVVTEDVALLSDDGDILVQIPAGTGALDANGDPLADITFEPLDTPPTPPDGEHVILPYDLGPGGATFNPPITITMTYDPEALPEGVTEENLILAYYDPAIGQWVELGNIVVDPVNNTISGTMSHFTVCAILAKAEAPASTSEAIPLATVEPASEATQEPTPVSTPAEDDGGSPTNVPLISGIAVAGAAALATVLFFTLRRRKGQAAGKR